MARFLLFVCCRRKDLHCSANAIQSEMRPVYMVTSILRDQQCMFGVKGLFMVEKVSLMKKNLVAVLFRRPMQRSLMRSNRRVMG